MKILVTGGAGFIGFHLTKRLLADGHKVICLDDFSTSTPSNIDQYLLNQDFEFIHGDVTIPIEIEVDGIINLACPASPEKYQRDPMKTLLTSVLGANNVLNLAIKNGARVLQASTSEIYGDPLSNPQNESYWGNVNPIGIRSCYDEGKRAAESLFMDAHRKHGVDIRIARIFNTYGPNMQIDDGRVVSNFVKQALTGSSLTVYGDGSQVRSFCYIADLVDGIMKLFMTENAFEPVNLGNPTPIKMIDLASTVIELCNSKSEISYEPLPQDDPRLREPDISKAVSLLQWHPTTNLDVGLRRTIDFFKGKLIDQ